MKTSQPGRSSSNSSNKDHAIKASYALRMTTSCTKLARGPKTAEIETADRGSCASERAKILHYLHLAVVKGDSKDRGRRGEIRCEVEVKCCSGDLFRIRACGVVVPVLQLAFCWSHCKAEDEQQHHGHCIPPFHHRHDPCH